jgi:hemolysin III
MFGKLREPVNGLTHLGGASVAAVGVLLLLYLGRGMVGKQAAFLVYGVSLVLMFSASAAYHSIRARPAALLWLRKFDHAAIYLLIAGTYTPICLHYFTGFWQWGVLAIVWGMALLGIGTTLFYVNKPRWLSAGIYLTMGWLCLVGTPQMLQFMPVGALAWLLLGGLVFTLGAIVYVTKRPDFYPGVFGFHEVWHIFVIVGCLCHFILIAAYLAPPTA